MVSPWYASNWAGVARDVSTVQRSGIPADATSAASMKNPCMACSIPRAVVQTNGPATVSERLRGLRSVLPDETGKRDVVLRNRSVASIIRALRRCGRPEAIVCQNDVAAVNALAACRSLRWRVPNDVLLAGFDDVACAPLLEPSLTSVRQPCKHIAGRAFDLLLARIGKDSRPAEDVRMSAELVVRSSTTRP